ncbi:alpha/beta hydrolase [Microcoleus sp. FACHB-SPT15]|nr:alpha/beta hydrolase [Microcoleus sp. FACHB-SPT15]
MKDEPDREPSNQKAISFQDKLGYALKSLPTLLTGIFSSALVLSIITTLLILVQPRAFSALTVLLSIGIFAIFATLVLLKLGDAIPLLPRLPLWVLLLGLLIGAVAIFSPVNPQSLLVVLLILFIASLAIVLALIALRLATYLRDNYRATNYGVLDLVELLRQLDQAVFETKLFDLIETKNLTEDLLNEIGETKEAWQAADRAKRMALWKKASQKAEIEQEIINQIPKIKLNFIGHSMGCMVVTNTIRILSDVFDPNSIQKNPSSEIGRVFSLGRLILVAPDIPTESIMPRRGNFLRSSLRRCEEAYVFSNEGDLALRLASTAANYFSFPARTRFSGYRLGNLTAKRFENKDDRRVRKLEEQDYGIVNLKDGELTKPYLELEIRVSNQEHRSLTELRPPNTVEKDKSNLVEDLPVADLFTYFDCTDYTDFTLQEGSQSEGIVSYALRKPVLNYWDYFRLINAYFFKRGSENINVHGGYFYGKFSHQAICELAFLGFTGFLNNLKPGVSLNEQLSELSTQARKKHIQVVLSRRVENLLNSGK